MGKTMGRPLKEIDREQFESLCSYMCTQSEIADFFHVSIATIARWCKRTYGETFEDTYKKHLGAAKCNLRKYQMNLAKTNPTMAIFLGKQYLGQKDRPDEQIDADKDDGYYVAIKDFSGND